LIDNVDLCRYKIKLAISFVVVVVGVAENYIVTLGVEDLNFKCVSIENTRRLQFNYKALGHLKF